MHSVIESYTSRRVHNNRHAYTCYHLSNSDHSDRMSDVGRMSRNVGCRMPESGMRRNAECGMPVLLDTPENYSKQFFQSQSQLHGELMASDF